MARELEKLTALEAQRSIRKGESGWHHDGGGLYLRINNDGAFWYFRYGAGGKNYLSLGPCHTVGLADARAKAAACRKLLLDGRDPKVEREAVRAATKAAAAAKVTFTEAADAYVESHRAGWETKKHASEVRETLRAYAEPTLGAVPVGAVDTTAILKVLKPIWTAKPETARRLRGRVEQVLDFAKVKGWRDGENAARWRGHLDHLLPSATKLHVIEHHKALPYAQLPDFMRDLRATDGTPARCLEFLILTASRMQEGRFATFAEIDSNGVWNIPASRMKKRRPHRVPLCTRALQIVAHQRQITRGPFIFPGERADCVSDSLIGRLLTTLDNDGATPHGFRSTFSDWAAETTEFPDSWIETALAHVIGSATARAYRRTDLLDQRRKLMDAWDRYCADESMVVPLRAAS